MPRARDLEGIVGKWAKGCQLNPETVPVTHFGTFTFGGSGICPHTSGISAVATSRSLATSLSSQ